MPRGKRKLEDGYTDEAYSYSYYGRSASNAYMSQPSRASGSVVTVSTSRLLMALDGREVDAGISGRAEMTFEETEKPKPKRARKAKDPDAPVPEKRGAIFKKACPKSILERVDRVISQRFFMIDRKREGQELKEVFSVLGSTGNVYTVTIDRRPSCNCPDAMKGNHCKHILFIFLKVLQVRQDSTHWYQKALLSSELEELFRDAPSAPNAMANARIRDAHAQCFQQWARTKGANLTCVFCRAAWVMADVVPGGSARAGSSREGYLNLGGVAGLSPIRDTSSYYNGPRRGERYYGYQKYDDYGY
ncbi:hypothetical protein M0805_003901 [Coniferiporia weirii]|nr:hypothetical protein M0805_003901 [Coniferiporia weirii]